MYRRAYSWDTLNDPLIYTCLNKQHRLGDFQHSLNIVSDIHFHHILNDSKPVQSYHYLHEHLVLN
jgi:hypothetical protein